MNKSTILVIDNYDSFTYNLVQYIGEIKESINVSRNDKINIQAIKKLSPSKIILSPGPGSPKDAGICSQIIKEFSSKVPILGVCLGHQVIGEVYGASVNKAPYLMHGKTSKVFYYEDNLFKNIENPFIATRYHSLIVEEKKFPDNLQIIATTEDNIIMAFKHKHYKFTYGIQFHPESILTQNGKQIIRNFLAL
nr:anthranilate synthase component 2 [Sciadococcus taiwanensis]